MKKDHSGSQQHDRYFRGSFREQASRELLESHEDPEWLALLDLDQLKIGNNHFQTLNRKSVITDLSIHVPLKSDNRQMINYSVEHQSRPDPLMAVRMHRYKAELIAKGVHTEKYVPLVLPIVFYTGKHAYPKKRSLSDLIKIPSAWLKEEKHDAYRVIWSQESESEAKGIIYPLVLLTFNSQYDKDLSRVEKLFRALIKIDTAEGKEFARISKEYVYTVHPLRGTRALIELESKILLEEGDNTMKTAAECLVRFGSIKRIRESKGYWMNQGKGEGEQLGIKQGTSSMLNAMRTEGISEEQIGRIQRIGLEELNRSETAEV